MGELISRFIMVTEKVLFQGFDCKTFENTCWFPPEVPDHHDSKSNDSEGLFPITNFGRVGNVQ